MSNKNSRKPKVSRSVLEMTAKQARVFLLKPESYCSLDLPPYFVFSKILSAVSKNLLGKTLASMSSKPRDHEGVNYSMLSNKDGRHAWRPFQLIHPALYIALVDQMTQPANWKVIRARFKEFQNPLNFKCLSIPVEAPSNTVDKAAQVRNWWLGIEQGSIELPWTSIMWCTPTSPIVMPTSIRTPSHGRCIRRLRPRRRRGTNRCLGMLSTRTSKICDTGKPTAFRKAVS